MQPRVLFVSKPIAPPWNDGSKNLVRDVANHLVRAKPTVMTTAGGPPLGPRVAMDEVYTEPGRFAPGLAQNARVVGRLVTDSGHDVWHFVFAPNPASSSVARASIRGRRIFGWKGRVVQTVASAPRNFDGVAGLLFGDAIVCVSEWMRGRLIGSGARKPVRVIPPCVDAPRKPVVEAIRATRAALGVPQDAPIVLYPGDYEVSRGAATVAKAVAAIAAAVPAAFVVFACRAKTPRSAEARAAVENDLRAAGLLGKTRHAGDVPDMPALLAASSVVAFPVDDLYGKVDVPLVLLEAMALGVPIVVAAGGPLEALSHARFVEPADHEGLAAACIAYLAKGRASEDAAKAGKALFAARFSPSVAAAAYDDLYAELLAAPADGD